MKTALSIAAASALVFMFWAGATDRIIVMGTATVAFLALLFFANVDRISKFKASAKGIEATTRAAEAVVKKAEATLAELQELATVTAKIQVSLIARSGRVGGYSDAEQEALTQETLSLLKSIGVSAAKQAEVVADAQSLAVVDYLHYIIPSGPPIIEQRFVAGWHRMHDRIFTDPPKPDELIEYFINANVLTDDRREWIEDYRYFLREKKHRRPDHWGTRNYPEG